MELLIMAQNDIIGFVPEITDEMLLYKGLNDKKAVIEYLIEMDKDLTISKIVSLIKKKQDPNFVIVLRNLGIDDNNIRIKTDDLIFSDDYIQQYNLLSAKYEKLTNGNHVIKLKFVLFVVHLNPLLI